jgi:16S rRNA C967 or C1407 C5-methylase (RsmB/RsmF family)/NOL1/NOP2/fmu family ribosome biogenesis protein
MFPEKFLKRIYTQKYIDAEALIQAMEQPSPVSIRINPSKWKGKPVDAEPVAWCGTGFYLDRKPSFTLDPLFHAGCYYPQEASGMFLGQALRQIAGSTSGIKILDLCGAPGGKSTLLSEIIGNDSLLVANEVIRSRAFTLAETITKWGLGNTLVTHNDPSSFGRLGGYFDVIVADAPCSGEGMFRNASAIKEWSYDNSLLCSERQKRIIMDVWPSLRTNGILIYSTCTFNPDENEENIRWFIEKNEAECLRLDIGAFKDITEIDYEGIYGYGFHPDKVRGEGFFIAVIRKKGKQDPVIKRQQLKPELKPDRKDIEIVNKLTEFPSESIIKWGDELLAVPCTMDDYLHLFNNLRIIKAGTRISVVKKNDYLPTHELALSVHLKEKAFPTAETDYKTALAYLSRGNFAINNIIEGWNILTYSGINIGFVKNIVTRLNNYFPVEWRIRMNLPESGKENIINWSKS